MTTGLRPRTILLLSCLAISLPALRAQSELGSVEIQLIPSAVLEEPAALEVQVHWGEPQQLRLALPGTLRLPIPETASMGKLTVHSDAWWAAEQDLPVAGAGGPIRVDVYPAGFVEGRLQTPRGLAPPEKIHLTLYSPDAWDRGERWSLPCPVVAPEDGQPAAFRCKIPAGTYDVRLRPGGFASAYFWKLSVTTEEPRSLGTLALQPGASVVGWVETTDATPFDDTTRVALHNAAQLDGSAVDQRLEAQETAAVIEKHGFFQITGLSPGGYRLLATQEGFAEGVSPEFLVVAGRESTLLDPLVLARPLRFDLRVRPSQDPHGKPWKVGLAQDSPRSRRKGETDAEGVWLAPALPEGDYRLSIQSHRGDRWHREELILAPWTPLEREVELTIVPIHGIVTLGGKPLEAHLWFGRRHGFERVHRHSDEEGHFRGFLPREGEWPLEVQLPGERQSVWQTEVVPVDLDPETGVAELRIELPATELSGWVLDASGQRLANAMVTVQYPTGTGSASQRTGRDGEFHFVGLPEGEIYLTAEQGDRASPRSSVALREATPARDVVLSLASHREISGRIVSAFGPVPRALLIVVPQVNREAWPYPNMLQHADLNGEFHFEVPDQATSVMAMILPRGFAARFLILPISGETPIEITVDQRGGSIRIDTTKDPNLPAGNLRLMAGQAWTSLNVLRHFWRTEVEGSDFILLNLEPNDYALCQSKGIDGSSPCSRGALAPFGELRLAPPTVEPRLGIPQR